MHEYHYIRYHFVRRSDCTYISFYGPPVCFALQRVAEGVRGIGRVCVRQAPAQAAGERGNS